MLTTKQQNMLRTISNLTVSQGFPPTIMELTETLGYGSTNSVRQCLKSLEKWGYVKRDPKVARGLKIVRFD